MARTRLLAAGVAVAASLALTACSGGVFGGDDGGGGKGTASSAPVLSAPKGLTLQTNSTAQLGTTVIDGIGFTLYRSDQDSADPPTSSCDDACAQTWKPVTYTDPVQLEGLDKNKVGKMARADGTEQVTIGGWPVYTKVGEQTGSTDSSGKDGWFAIAPDGKKAQQPA